MKQPVILEVGGNIPKPNEDHSHVIPQSAPAQNLYKLLVEMGKTPREAALEVLKVATSHIQLESK